MGGMEEDNLKSEIGLDRDFYTDLEHMIVSIVHTRETFMRLSNRYLEDKGISLTQLNALMSIYDHEQSKPSQPLTQKALADKLLINKASAGTLIKRLEKQGWVETVPSPEDGRAKYVNLTTDGYAQLERIFSDYYLYLAPLSNNISYEEFRSLLSTLQKLRDNIENFDSTKP